jgi:hypothetical protein
MANVISSRSALQLQNSAKLLESNKHQRLTVLVPYFRAVIWRVVTPFSQPRYFGFGPGHLSLTSLEVWT